MKIEITDREIWLECVRHTIEWIVNEQEARNSKALDVWRARKNAKASTFLGRFFGARPVGPTETPPLPDCVFDTMWLGDGLFWPTLFGREELDRLRLIERSLTEEHVGSIFISGEDLQIIRPKPPV